VGNNLSGKIEGIELRVEKKVWAHQKRVKWRLSKVLEWKARAMTNLGPRILEFFKENKESRLIVYNLLGFCHKSPGEMSWCQAT